jgi:hypothetical protein
MFQHDPFIDPSKEIRLLRILPGAPGSQLQLELHHVEFSPPGLFIEDWSSREEYHALSYQWGPPPEDHQIMLNGESFKIRKNLYTLLVHLRSHFENPARGFLPALIWCDAICINQLSDNEKNQQVRMMAQIYTYAQRTYAWLGEAADSSDLVMDSITYLLAHSTKKTYKPGEFFSFDPSELKNFLNSHNVRTDSYRSALRCFLNRVYWSRLWVVQEYSLSRESFVLCSDRWLPSSCCAVFESISSSLFKQEDPTPYGQFLASELFSSRRDMRDFLSKPRQLLLLYQLIVRFGRQECFDPRDHVYALLGMSKEFAHGRSFPIRYDASPASLIADLVTFYEGEYELDAAKTLLLTFEAHPATRGKLSIKEISGSHLLNTIQCERPLQWVGEASATETWPDGYGNHRFRLERSHQVALPWLHLAGERVKCGDHVVEMSGSFLGIICRPYSQNVDEVRVAGLALFLAKDDTGAQVYDRYCEGLNASHFNLIGRTMTLDNVFRENEWRPQRKSAKDLSMALSGGLVIAAAEYQVEDSAGDPQQDWQYALRHLSNPLGDLDEEFAIRNYITDRASRSQPIDVICIPMS